VLIVRMLVTLILSTLVFIFSAPIANSFFGGAEEIVQFTSAFILLTTLHAIYRRILRIFRHIKILSIVSVVDGYGAVILYAIFLFNGYGLYGIVIASLIFKFAITLFLVLYATPQIGYKWPDFSLLKIYFKYGLPTLAASMSFWLVNISDRYILSYLVGTSSVGIYSAGYTIGHIPYLFSGVINFILMVALSELYDSGKMAEVKNHLSYSLKYFLTLAIPFFFGSIIYAEQLLSVLSTNEIAVSGRYVSPIVSLAHLFLGAYTVYTFVLLLTKKTIKMSKIWMIVVPLNIGLNIALIPYLGIEGAAISTLIAYFIALCAIYYFAQKEFAFPVNWIFICKAILASLVMSLTIEYFPWQGGLLFTVVTIIIGVSIYFVVMIILRGFDPKEYRLITSLLQRKNKN